MGSPKSWGRETRGDRSQADRAKAVRLAAIQVWTTIQPGWNKKPHTIRRMLTEGAVRATDRRACFVGPGAYEAAGGIGKRYLFQEGDGGWLQGPALLDRQAAERLAREADAVRARPPEAQPRSYPGTPQLGAASALTRPIAPKLRRLCAANRRRRQHG